MTATKHRDTSRASAPKLALALLSTACVAACSDPAGQDLAMIEREWILRTTRSGFVCSMAVAVTQSGEAFEASYTDFGTCTALGNVFRNDHAGPITAGRIDGGRVSFADAICSFVGTVVDRPATRMSGTMSCPSIGRSGRWTATR